MKYKWNCYKLSWPYNEYTENHILMNGTLLTICYTLPQNMLFSNKRICLVNQIAYCIAYHHPKHLHLAIQII